MKFLCQELEEIGNSSICPEWDTSSQTLGCFVCGRSEWRGEVLEQFSFISIIWPQFQKWCRRLGHGAGQDAGPAGMLQSSFRTPARRHPPHNTCQCHDAWGAEKCSVRRDRALWPVVLGYASWEKSHWWVLGDPSSLCKHLDLRGYGVRGEASNAWNSGWRYSLRQWL